MVKPKRTRGESSDMGAASLQSKSLGKSGVGDPGKGKRKKSKSKRSERDDEGDPVADRAALEEESARALMLLSTAALQHGTSAPYYNLEDKGAPSGQVEQPAVQTQVGDQTPGDELGGKLHKKGKSKEKSKKKKKPWDKRDIQAEDQHQSSPPEELPTARPSHHPLDEEPSDDEMVQEYETGGPREQSQNLEDLTAHTVEGFENQSEIPVSKHDSNDAGSAKKKTSNKRKRQVGEFAINQNQSQALPIDPSLHDLDGLAPSYPDPLDALNAHALPELQQRASKKRKTNQQPEIAHGENEYNGHLKTDDRRDDDHGIVVQGLEDELGPLYSAFDPPDDEGYGDGINQLNPESGQIGDHDKPGRGGKGGFTAADIARLDSYRDHYCGTNNLTVPDFNHLIQLKVKSNEFVNRIFNEIQDLFPDRTRAAVQRFCRRHFHNFHARGVWTPEEEADLRAAVAEKGTSWKAVGELLGRFNEDCRDRWRNYLAPSAAHRNRDAWTEKEVINLSNSIIDCMQLMKKERQRAKEEESGHEIPLSESDSDQEAEDLKLVNWQTVSDMMGSRGTARSRIQCSFKWGKIKKADRDRYLKEVKEAQNNLRDLEKGKYTANNMRRSTGWRLKAAAKQVKNMKSGDKYDLLNAILVSAAPEEDNIPWRMIGDEDFRQKWTFSERKAGWFAMKKQVDGSEDMDYRQVIQSLMTDLLAEGVNERWIPTSSHPVRKQTETRRKSHQNKGLSREGNDSNGLLQEAKEGNSKDPAYENNEAAEHVRAAPAANMRRGGYISRSESPNSLFDGEQPDLDQRGFEHQPSDLGEVSPELAGRIQLLRSA